MLSDEISTLRIGFLGPVRVIRASVDLKVDPALEAVLLALVSRLDQVVSLAQLIDDLWGRIRRHRLRESCTTTSPVCAGSSNHCSRSGSQHIGQALALVTPRTAGRTRGAVARIGGTRSRADGKAGPGRRCRWHHPVVKRHGTTVRWKRVVFPGARRADERRLTTWCGCSRVGRTAVCS
jgi:hypothetical protein